MTRNGIVKQKYHDMIEPRPYSRFTQDLEEANQNDLWTLRALDWGFIHFDNVGNCKHIDFDDTLDSRRCRTCHLQETA